MTETPSSEHTDEPIPGQVSIDGEETPQDPQQAETEPRQDDGPNAEAMKYRHRAKEAEAERDQLRGQVEALQCAEVDRLAEAESVKPSALWAAGTQLSDMVGADGTVDADAVGAAVEAAREEFGLPKNPRLLGNHVPREGHTPSTSSSGRDMLSVVMGRDQE